VDAVFETERLAIRGWLASDEAAFAAMYADPEVMEFLQPAVGELEPIATRFARYAAAGTARDFGIWAVLSKSTSEVVGTTMLKPLPDSDDEIEVGWHLARPHWGQGYATESARGAIQHGFESLDLERVVSVVEPRNVRSIAVAERIGMRGIGMGRHYGLDVQRFEILRG